MPRFDKTGPFGFGPRTGWGRGPCGMGLGGRGYGPGYGYGRRGFWGMTKKEEREVLADETELLEEELKAIKKRLAELKGTK